MRRCWWSDGGNLITPLLVFPAWQDEFSNFVHQGSTNNRMTGISCIREKASISVIGAPCKSYGC